MATNYPGLSFWMDSIELPAMQRPPIDAPAEFDVAIVGGGLTGLWTAYYAKIADPNLNVAVFEREICGFGASGRNGGWASALFPQSMASLAARFGRSAAIAMVQAMVDSLVEVRRVVAAEGIECDLHAGGTLTLGRTEVQVAKLRSELEEAREFGFGEDYLRFLDKSETDERMVASGTLSSLFTPHCARIQPAKLVRGLAEVCERIGVKIFEGSRVLAIAPGRVEFERFSVKAGKVIRATEGYTSQLRGEHRTLMPIYSMMIATEPLDRDQLDSIGWTNRETFTDARSMIIYGQLTADGRIAFGGRGAPYHFGSRIGGAFDRDVEVAALLRQSLVELFPSLAKVGVTHHWGGPLGVPRDWMASVGLDNESGIGWAGGYVGDGVTTTNLAGRTLADLICSTDSDLIRLPWVGHRSRKWEVEPLRYAGVNLAIRLTKAADRRESNGTPHPWQGRLADLVRGRT